MTELTFQDITQSPTLDTLPNLVDIIREITMARRWFPVIEGINIETLQARFHNLNETNNAKTRADLESPDLSGVTSTPATKDIPLHQDTIMFNRMDKKRASRDIVTLDKRENMMIERVNNLEEIAAIAGNALLSLTALADVTNNTTAATGVLDVDDFAKFTKQFMIMKGELVAAMKNQLRPATPLYVIMTDDVFNQIEAVFSTTNDTVNATSWLAGILGGRERILHTDFLGSEAGSGTKNFALGAKSASNYALLSSALERVEGESPLKDWTKQVTLRSYPLWFRQEATIYEAGVTLT